jgi:hypothetical protein
MKKVFPLIAVCVLLFSCVKEKLPPRPFTCPYHKHD